MSVDLSPTANSTVAFSGMPAPPSSAQDFSSFQAMLASLSSKDTTLLERHDQRSFSIASDGLHRINQATD